MKKRALSIALIFVLMFTTLSTYAANGVEPKPKEADVITLNQWIQFDGFAIKFGDKAKWTKIEYGNHAGKDVFGIPVSVKNLTKEPKRLEKQHYITLGPNGKELLWADNEVQMPDRLWNIGKDDGEFAPGKTIKRHLYIAYEKDGEYTIRFERWNLDTVNIMFDVKKPK